MQLPPLGKTSQAWSTPAMTQKSIVQDANHSIADTENVVLL